MNESEMRGVCVRFKGEWVEEGHWGFVLVAMGPWINNYKTVEVCCQFSKRRHVLSLQRCSKRRRDCCIGSVNLLAARRLECCSFVSSLRRFSFGSCTLAKVCFFFFNLNLLLDWFNIDSWSVMDAYMFF